MAANLLVLPRTDAASRIDLALGRLGSLSDVTLSGVMSLDVVHALPAQVRR